MQRKKWLNKLICSMLYGQKCDTSSLMNAASFSFETRQLKDTVPMNMDVNPSRNITENTWAISTGVQRVFAWSNLPLKCLLLNLFVKKKRRRGVTRYLASDQSHQIRQDLPFLMHLQ